MNLQLKRLRKLAGYKTQGAFANKIGVPERRYQSWERQEATMNLEQACLVCDALDCTLDELVGRKVTREYTDAGQEIINICYESMNERGKETLVSVAQSMERDAANRIAKNQPRTVETGSKEDVA